MEHWDGMQRKMKSTNEDEDTICFTILIYLQGYLTARLRKQSVHASVTLTSAASWCLDNVRHQWKHTSTSVGLFRRPTPRLRTGGRCFDTRFRWERCSPQANIFSSFSSFSFFWWGCSTLAIVALPRLRKKRQFDGRGLSRATTGRVVEAWCSGSPYKVSSLPRQWLKSY